ncbi:MAG: hypothetical protein ACE5F7_05150, partial [Nitrospiria bacterium]
MLKQLDISSALKYLAVLAVGAIIPTLFEVPVEHWFSRYFEKKEISYELISSTKLSRHEVQEYSKAEG